MKQTYRTMRTAILLLLFALIVTACTFPITERSAANQATEQESTDTPPIPVFIAVGAPNTPVYLNFDVAQTLGYFADEGLEVELHYFDGGSDAAEALKTGAADFSGNAMDHVLEAQMTGKELRMLMNFLDHPCATLVVRNDLAATIQTPADLRGQKVGVTRFGSATHTLAVFVAAQAGVTADEFEVVEVGASAMADALIARTVDVAMGVAPYTTRLIQTGEVNVLVDLCQPAQAQAAMGGGLPFTGLLTRAELITEQPDVVQRVVNALVRAQTFITSHSAEEIVAALPAAVTGDDTTAFVDALETTLPAFSQDGGRVEPEGLQILLQLHEIFGTISAATEVNLDALYDNQFVTEAQKQKP